MYKILEKSEEQNYKEFLEKSERCNFQASKEWANVKSNWINEIVLVYRGNNIVGSISILIRKIPIFGNFMYSSRGPICDINDKEVLEELTNGIREISKKYNAFVIVIEPDIKSNQVKFKNIVTNLGYKIKDNAKDFIEEIQPRYVFRLDIKNKTEEEILANFAQKTRYNIRLAIKKGVVVKEGTREDIKRFHEIMVETGKRDDFVIRPCSYFEKMYDALGPKHIKLLMAKYQEKYISGVIAIFYGNKTWYLYGASSNEYRNVMPNYLLQWEMIKMAIERKDDIFDFRGVSGVVDEKHPQYGLYRFKKSFGAEFTEFIGEVYLPFKPLKYKIYKISEKFYRKFGYKIIKLLRL